MKTPLSSFGTLSQALLFSAWILTLGFFSACTPEVDNTLKIEQVAPGAVHQGEGLLIVGKGFGAWNGERNDILINGSCADVITWGAETITLTVPAGVGVGARTLTLITESGARVDHPLEITGDNLPATERRCQRNIIIDDSDTSGGEVFPENNWPNNSQENNNWENNNWETTSPPIWDVVDDFGSEPNSGYCDNPDDLFSLEETERSNPRAAREIASFCAMIIDDDAPLEPADLDFCMREYYGLELSLECSTCFMKEFLCINERCIAPCESLIDDPECLECRDIEGCTNELYQCAGELEVLDPWKN